MKKILLYIILNLPAFLFSQESFPLIKVSDFYLSAGAHSGNYSLNLNDLIFLGQNATILPSDLSEYFGQTIFDNSSQGSMLSMSLGFSFLDKKNNNYRSNPQLKAGLMFIRTNSWNSSLEKESFLRFDTLISSTTNNVIYIDSVYNTQIQIDYQTEFLLLDLELMYKTDPAERWHVFGGIGLAGGISLNASTKVNVYHQKYQKYVNPSLTDGLYALNTFSTNVNSEVTKNDLSILAQLQFPVGVSFRISDSVNFWKRINAYFEATPLLQYIKIPETGTYFPVGIKFGLGIKVNLSGVEDKE